MTTSTYVPRMFRLDALGAEKVTFVTGNFEGQVVLARGDWEAWGRPDSVLVEPVEKK